MPIGDYCRAPVQRASPSESLRVVAQRMDREGVGSIVIVDGERVSGVVTDRDVALAVLERGQDPDATPVCALIDHRPVVAHAASPLRVAAGLMRAHGVRRLPVVDAEERLVGVISRDDLLQLLGRELGAMSAALGLQDPHGSSLVSLDEMRRWEEVV